MAEGTKLHYIKEAPQKHESDRKKKEEKTFTLQSTSFPSNCHPILKFIVYPLWGRNAARAISRSGILGLWMQFLLTKGKMCYNAPYKSLNLRYGAHINFELFYNPALTVLSEKFK
ncbi:hypothetical protein [Dictyobacter aurantiacus]|uniref:Uncharacterized protein n=1 Tax=Dictyobacter aurantiacus TaxID=1936993 RepID=A0A401ZF03_9CHLR|nr:hypothetical protein [Dictyobacter aurantiacus]GCE05454.1 hypothetical protein KDAU_27830 [Dictyobacter aurantiacus]